MAGMTGGTDLENMAINDSVETCKRVNVLGIPVAALSSEEVMSIVDSHVATRRQLYIGVVNASKIVNMNRDDDLRNDVLASDLILADGSSVVWAARMLGQQLPGRVTGIDLMTSILELANAKELSVYLLGASEQVSAAVEARVRSLYPRARIAGRRNGYFSNADEAQIAQHIADSRADFLLVAISSPKKEHFMAAWRDKLSVSVIHGVGGSFDVFSGQVRRAPMLMQKTGLEWAFRVMQEPRRLFWRYFETNILFCLMLAKEIFKSATSGQKH